MSETITLYVPEKFVSETRKIDFVYRYKMAAESLAETIKLIVAMSPVPEDYRDMHEYKLACNANEARLYALRNMLVNVQATWMLADRVKVEDED
jgi:hypothetical protein